MVWMWMATCSTYRVVSSPSHGTLNATAPNLTYTPVRQLQRS